MNIVRFKGGLGNQMFQYAFMKSIEFYKKQKTGADLGYYRDNVETRKFELSNAFKNIRLTYSSEEEYLQKREKWEMLKKNADRLKDYDADEKKELFYIEKKPYFFDNKVYLTGECVFVGYWQSEKYFSLIREELIQDFTFNVSNSIERKVQMLTNEASICSVHVRLGDYMDNGEIYGNICTTDYYRRAMDIVEKVIPNVKFLVLSDDIDKALQIVGRRNVINLCHDEKQDNIWNDMYVMTKCCANIIANSSYSWWGAYLNTNDDKIVVSPKKWINNSTINDIWCEEWIKI